MNTKHTVITILLIVGLLYVYHVFVAQKGTFGQFKTGLGIAR